MEVSVCEVKADADVSTDAPLRAALCRFTENSAPEVRKTFIFTDTRFQKCRLMSGSRFL